MSAGSRASAAGLDESLRDRLRLLQRYPPQMAIAADGADLQPAQD